MVFKSSVLILSRAWLAKIKLVFFWNTNAKTLPSYEAITPTQKYPSWQSLVLVVSLANARKHTRSYMTRPDIAENKSDSIGFEAELIR